MQTLTCLQIVKPPEGYVTSKLMPSEQLIDTTSTTGVSSSGFRIPEFNGAPEGYSKSEY